MLYIHYSTIIMQGTSTSHRDSFYDSGALAISPVRGATKPHLVPGGRTSAALPSATFAISCQSQAV